MSDVEGTSLRIDPAIVDAKAPLAVQVGVTRADACVLVAAYCRGAMVGQQLIDKSRFTRRGMPTRLDSTCLWPRKRPAQYALRRSTRAAIVLGSR